MLGEVLQADIKALSSLGETVKLLRMYAEQELQSCGHGTECATALIVTIQTADELIEKVRILDEKLIAQSAGILGIKG